MRYIDCNCCLHTIRNTRAYLKVTKRRWHYNRMTVNYPVNAHTSHLCFSAYCTCGRWNCAIRPHSSSSEVTTSAVISRNISHLSRNVSKASVFHSNLYAYIFCYRSSKKKKKRNKKENKRRKERKRAFRCTVLQSRKCVSPSTLNSSRTSDLFVSEPLCHSRRDKWLFPI